jgi:phosphonate transport system substrate-binding protein
MRGAGSPVAASARHRLERTMPRSVLALLGVVSLGVACGTPAPPTVSLAEPIAGEGVPAADAMPPVRLAVAAMMSPRATLDAYAPFVAYLEAKLQRPVRLLQRPTYADVNELMRVGAIDAAFVCTGAFVEGERVGAMELVAAPVVRGDTRYYALVIVPAGSSAQSLDELRGAVFAFTDPLSNTGYLAVQWALAQRGTTPEAFFRSTFFTSSHDKSIEAVANGVADGASVDSLVYERATAREPAYARRTRVLLRLGPYGTPPFVVRPQLASGLKRELRRVVLGMGTDPAARPALEAVGVERFVVPDPEAYQSVRAMAAALRRWR